MPQSKRNGICEQELRLRFNPDSAVPADARSEEQTFRSEVNGSLPLSGHRSSWFKTKSKTYNGEVRSSEKDFETLQLGAFATPGLLLAQGPVGLTAESGFSLTPNGRRTNSQTFTESASYVSGPEKSTCKNSTRTKTMSELKVVGTAAPRGEGSDKGSGRTLYAADVNLPGTLWAKILRSPHSHARILNIDVSKAQRIRGVKAILTGSEVQGHLIGKQIRDMPVLCWDRVRFVGDRVAAVAAESADAAQDAVDVIDFDYESLAAVFDPLEAMQPSAPRLHDDVTVYDGGPKDKLAPDLHNGLTRLAYKKGDVEKGFREADLVLEHVFHIPGRHQGYLEPHAALVAIDPDCRIQVWISAKNPFGVRSQLAKCLQLPEERIRINVVNVGGEFGGKGDAIDVPIAYFLSHRTGRPLKIVMTYAEELSASNPAHPTVITVRSGVKRDGRIVARM